MTSLGEYSPDEDAVAGGTSYRVVRHADAAAGVYRKFVLRDGRVVGATTINDPRRGALARQLIDRGTEVSEYGDLLVDDGFDLGSLM